MKKFKRRIIPKISFINYHKSVPISKGIWNKWLSVSRAWSGNIIMVQIKHFAIELDFRKNWLNDMAGK